MLFDTTSALDARDKLPPDTQPAQRDRSAWGAIVRGPLAAGAEVFGQLLKLDEMSRLRSGPTDPEQMSRMERIRAESRAKHERMTENVLDYGRSLRLDAATGSAAEQAVFGVSRGLTKAVASVVALGPVPGAAAFGGSEAAVTYEDLRSQGVDEATAGKAAAVAGVGGAVGVALPMAGSTLGRTAALYAVGGPGQFVAQTAATREILSRANYDELAKQYDPWDPLGLGIATAFSAPFAVAGAVRNIRTAKAVKAGGAPAVEPEAPAVAPMARETVDAAMAHNLTIARDIVDARVARAEPAMPPVDPEAPSVALRTDDMDQPIMRQPDMFEAAPAAPEDGASLLAAARAIGADADAPEVAAMMQRTIDDAGRIAQEMPDVAVGKGADDGAVGKTARQILDDAKALADDGSDGELGRMDMDLVRAAINCEFA